MINYCEKMLNFWCLVATVIVLAFESPARIYKQYFTNSWSRVFCTKAPLAENSFGAVTVYKLYHCCTIVKYCMKFNKYDCISFLKCCLLLWLLKFYGVLSIRWSPALLPISAGEEQLFLVVENPMWRSLVNALMLHSIHRYIC